MTNNKFYQNSISKYGISAKGVHWDSKTTQYKRFDAITSFIANNDNTLIDAGCGFAEYYKYLKINNYKHIKYIGYDCYENFITISKQRFSNINIQHKDILKDDLLSADYYVCSGALNILKKEEVKLFIKNCFSKSKKAFIFNYLKEQNISNYSINEIVNICKVFSPNISIKDDYLDNDFTIYLFK